MPERVEITGPVAEHYDEILTPQALDLLGKLHAELAGRRAEALAARRRRQAELIGGAMLDFLPETARIREDTTWRVAPPAPGLEDRRVEITGPTDRKMTVNALNSGANVWLADFEDANTPLWENMIGGQLNLKDALDQRGRQELHAQTRRRARHDCRPPPRLAPGREAYPHRRQTGLRQPDRLRLLYNDICSKADK
jgi:malate synthase A